MTCKHTQRLRAIGDYYVCAYCAMALKEIREGINIRLVPVRMKGIRS